MEKKTHIIIPIKDIEEAISELKKELSFTDRDYKSAIGTLNRHKYAFLMSLSRGVISDKIAGKQISLDEKDIEEKAKRYCRNEPMFSPALLVKAYIQALKDLI